MSATEKQETPKGGKKRRNPWMRALKVVLIIVLAVLLLIIAAVGTVVWILTPARLTPIVNRVVTEQIDGTAEAKRVELTFWSTFPRLTLEIDSLEVVSYALKDVDEATRRRLPADADSLLGLAGIRGSVDIPSLLIGRIALYDVELRHPRINAVQVDSLTANYNIVPPSEEKEEESGPMVIPDVSINRFVIADGFPIKFVSLADSLSVEAEIARVELGGEDAPRYVVDMKGSGGGRFAELKIPPTPFGLDGSIEWSPSSPRAVKVEGLEVSADEVAVKMDASVEIADSLTIREFVISSNSIGVDKLIKLVPEDMRGELGKISTSLKVSFMAKLLAPYAPSTGKIPPVEIDFKMPKGSFAYQRLQLRGVELRLSGRIDPEQLDRSVIKISRLAAEGKAINFSLEGTVKRPLSDPDVEGRFEGNIDFSLLPPVLTERLPATISGILSGEADFKLKQSYLTQRGFHKIKLDGSLELRNFRARMNDGSGGIYTRLTRLEFGTNSHVTVNGASVDSLLTASLTIDTIAAGIPGVGLTGSGISMGVGSRNVSSSFDTTMINPVGATIKAHRLHLRSDSDSIRLNVTDAMLKATLQRYKNQGRSPLLCVDFDMKRMRMADQFNRVSLKDVSSAITLHPKSRPAMSRRMQALYDSVAAQHPGLGADSLMKLTRRASGMRRRAAHEGASGQEKVDFGVDNSLRSWLRLWQLEGTLKAGRAMLFTPYFPVRNSITGLDMTFSTDSVALRNTLYKMGKSDFLINGTISNISRALTSRRGNQPLKIELNVQSDTLNINEVTRTMMMGSAFADKIAAGEARMPDSESDEVMSVAMANAVEEDARGAILIPTNIEGKVSVKANSIRYGDLTFNRFAGELEARNGAVHLDRLGAYTPLGSFGMTALYSAPTKEDIHFAGGIIVKRLDLREFLDMLPEIDTIMPMLSTMEGIITAECAMTTELDSMMNLKFHTLDMALKLSGDSLVVLDSETFRTVSKWLMFKNKQRNMIDSMSVEMIIRNNVLQLYPFMVTMDRYKFGISGNNDMDLNLDYHIAVLKSPIPFKFGVNIKGTPEHMKIRLGGAKFSEKDVASTRQITDTVRVNLINQIEKMFNRGMNARHDVRLSIGRSPGSGMYSAGGDTISHADSLYFIRQGVIPKPLGWVDPYSVATASDSGKGKKKKK